jgi:hypothetical protein
LSLAILVPTFSTIGTTMFLGVVLRA